MRCSIQVQCVEVLLAYLWCGNEGRITAAVRAAAATTATAAYTMCTASL
jgi:hypothetical protein